MLSLAFIPLEDKAFKVSLLSDIISMLKSHDFLPKLFHEQMLKTWDIFAYDLSSSYNSLWKLDPKILLTFISLEPLVN